MGLLSLAFAPWEEAVQISVPYLAADRLAADETSLVAFFIVAAASSEMFFPAAIISSTVSI